MVPILLRSALPYGPFGILECTPMWSLLLFGVHSHVVLHNFWSALPYGPYHFQKCTPKLSPLILYWTPADTFLIHSGIFYWIKTVEKSLKEAFVMWSTFDPDFELYGNSSRSSGWVNHRTKILERRSHGSELPTIYNSRLNSPGRSIRSGPISRSMSTRCGRSMRSSFRKKAEVNISHKQQFFWIRSLTDFVKFS